MMSWLRGQMYSEGTPCRELGLDRVAPVVGCHAERLRLEGATVVGGIGVISAILHEKKLTVGESAASWEVGESSSTSCDGGTATEREPAGSFTRTATFGRNALLHHLKKEKQRRMPTMAELMWNQSSMHFSYTCPSNAITGSTMMARLTEQEYSAGMLRTARLATAASDEGTSISCSVSVWVVASSVTMSWKPLSRAIIKGVFPVLSVASTSAPRTIRRRATST
mmetsp:Transcript_6024/g.8427  ORF Transcript_6024/g.8427 Transcript_6024/m.8427 type:complete len:224 (+) Transcript_6024:380-1051(+)